MGRIRRGRAGGSASVVDGGLQKADRDVLQVVILSGGTGRTAETVLRAALAQFDSPHYHYRSFTQVRTVRQAVAAVSWAARHEAVLFHSLVDPKIRQAVRRAIERREVMAVDVLGPALSILADKLGQTPRGQAGLAYMLNKEQFDRMDAVDFTLAHDDGLGLHDLDRSDVVLVGVSRVGKSALCFFLAYRGIRAANVPLVGKMPVPPELERLPPKKVIGLTMNPQRLLAIRLNRAAHGLTKLDPNYVDEKSIARELREARRVMETHGWRWLDVSYMAIEEAAFQIRNMLDL